MALAFTQAHAFPQVQAKSVTDTLLEVECETLETHWPLEALIDAVADTNADVKTGALLNNLADTVAEVEAETLYKTAVVQVCLRTIVMQMRLVAIQSLLNFGVMTVYSGHPKGNICN